MAKLVKIKNVYLYTGTDTTIDVDQQAKNILESNNIPYTLLSYHVADQHQSVFTNLSTWQWGLSKQARSVAFFPIIHWDECYDDYEKVSNVALGVQELKESNLLIYAALVEK